MSNAVNMVPLPYLIQGLAGGEKDLLELQATLMSIPRNTPLVLCGDFNAPHVDWTSRTVEASAPLEDLLCEVSLDSGLDQLVKHPTRGGNILDLVFSNSNVSVDDVEVVDSIPGADHDAVHFSLAGKTLQYPLLVEELCITLKRQIFLNSDPY